MMGQDANLVVIFLTGLTTGGLSCLAIQGGLLASVLAKKEKDYSRKLINQNDILPVASFLVSKLITHTLLGALLGLLGTAITLTPQMRGWFQILIGIYLVGIALATLQVHPIFRYLIITPPKFMSRVIKNKSNSNSVFAPAILGALTIFIPCATTQAMEVIALGTANPLYAAAIMFAFVLGTSPTFFILGFIISKVSEKFQNWFHKVAAALLIIMAVVSVNGGISLLGSIYTIQNFVEAAKASSSSRPNTNGQVSGVTITEGVQQVNIDVYSSGYKPNKITIKKGIKTRVNLRSHDVDSCAQAFSIPSLNIQKLLPQTGNAYVEFTPTKEGPLVFSCSMGMYTGIFNVI